jgi:hypothetical protein
LKACIQQERELHRQGKNLESTTNKRRIHVTDNGDSKSEQQSAIVGTKRSKVGERTLQGNLQTNRTQQQSVAHNRNQDTALHEQSPLLHPNA